MNTYICACVCESVSVCVNSACVCVCNICTSTQVCLCAPISDSKQFIVCMSMWVSKQTPCKKEAALNYMNWQWWRDFKKNLFLLEFKLTIIISTYFSLSVLWLYIFFYASETWCVSSVSMSTSSWFCLEGVAAQILPPTSSTFTSLLSTLLTFLVLLWLSLCVSRGVSRKQQHGNLGVITECFEQGTEMAATEIYLCICAQEKC